MNRTLCLLATFAAVLAPAAALAQTTLERTPNLAGPWVALPGMIELDVLQRWGGRPGEGIGSLPTVFGALGLRPPLMLAASFATPSPVAPGQSDELEIFARWRPLEQARDAPVDAGIQLGYNTAAESVDAEVAAARRLGPVRVLAAARAFSNGYGADEWRIALAGGAVWHPWPGRAPVALAGDVASLLDRDGREEVVWGAGLQVGLSFIASALSLQATNATSGTLEGRSLGLDATRWGFELTVPVPTFGQLVGYYVPREQAVRAVAPAPAPSGAPRVARVEVRDYLFLPDRIVIPAGATVEWVNRDRVVHTATADDAAWDSGAIPPGGRWAATFAERGVYPYHCGPHPFMRGVVIVR